LVFGIIVFFILSSVNTNISGLSQELHLENYTNNIYYSYDQLTKILGELKSQYPNIFTFDSIGKTYQLRDIWLVKISDNVTIDEDEPEVLFMGGVHGDEKPGYQVIIYTIVALLENYSTFNVNQSFTNYVRSIVNNSELYFIPMVNPDGAEADCRKNQRPNNCLFGNTFFRGVDVNRNFGYKWDEFNKHPFKYAFGAFPYSLKRTNIMYPFLDFDSIRGGGNYRGSYPFSENESSAIKYFVENHSIIISIDYHTTGELITYPWTWTNDPPPDENIFLSIGENISLMNGYKLLQGSKWYYIIGCSKDWLYAEHGVFPFTIELCNSSGPLAPQDKEHILNICENHLLVNLYVAECSITLIK
jgi:hypothetical protein